MNLKKLATSGAALVALTAPAFLASQAHADTSLYVKYLLLIDDNGNETLIYYDLKGKKRFLLTEGTLTIYNDYALPKTIQERKPYDKS